METIEAIISRRKSGAYMVRSKDGLFRGIGKTIVEAKAEMCQKLEPLLNANDKIHYTFDIRSLLRHYVHKGYFTVEGLAVLTGVSQERLSVYIDGLTPSDRESIELALLDFKEDLEKVLPYWVCSGETPEKSHKGELIELIEKIHRS